MGSQKGVEQLEGTTEHLQWKVIDDSRIGYIYISSVGPLGLAAAGSGLKGIPQLQGNHTNPPIKSK